MDLKVPTEGFTSFTLVREIGDNEEVTVLLGEESYVMALVPLRTWLRIVGCLMIDKLLDVAWNYRVTKFDLSAQHLTIPEDQSNPLEEDLPPLPFHVESGLPVLDRSRAADPFGDPQLRTLSDGGII